jgi:hypothetical protein
MYRRFVVILALGAMALSDSPARAQRRAPRRGDPSARYGWTFSLAEGKAQARKSGKPLMVVLRCVP